MAEKAKPEFHPRSKDPWRMRVMQTKWDSLKKRGINPPKDSEEARRRLKEAHEGP